MTGPMVASEAKKFAKKNGLVIKTQKSEAPTVQALARQEMVKFRSVLEKLQLPERFNQLLLGISILIDQVPDQSLIEVSVTEVAPSAELESME
jgi:hypothetical protein